MIWISSYFSSVTKSPLPLPRGVHNLRVIILRSYSFTAQTVCTYIPDTNIPRRPLVPLYARRFYSITAVLIEFPSDKFIIHTGIKAIVLLPPHPPGIVARTQIYTFPIGGFRPPDDSRRRYVIYFHKVDFVWENNNKNEVKKPVSIVSTVQIVILIIVIISISISSGVLA